MCKHSIVIRLFVFQMIPTKGNTCQVMMATRDRYLIIHENIIHQNLFIFYINETLKLNNEMNYSTIILNTCDNINNISILLFVL